MKRPAKVLLVDDNENERFLWREIVTGFGYEVRALSSGRQALEFLRGHLPDLILLDLKMPELSGLEVCRRIRNHPRLRTVPVIMLTSSDDLGDKLKGFENGVDDYITKEMDLQEIEKRIEAVLKRYQQSIDTNPLTRLPGNNAIQYEIAQRLETQAPLAVAYCDLDHFKAFNDAYGFAEGDRVIRFTARILQEAVEKRGNPDDFLGHIGGDDFIFLSTPPRVQSICRLALRSFEQGIAQFYSSQDMQRGYFVAQNRQGEQQKFPLISISIAVVTNENRVIRSLGEISHLAGELKKKAKSQPGNVFVVDQRREE